MWIKPYLLLLLASTALSCFISAFLHSSAFTGFKNRFCCSSYSIIPNSMFKGMHPTIGALIWPNQLARHICTYNLLNTNYGFLPCSINSITSRRPFLCGCSAGGFLRVSYFYLFVSIQAKDLAPPPLYNFYVSIQLRQSLQTTTSGIRKGWWRKLDYPPQHNITGTHATTRIAWFNRLMRQY